MQLKIVKSLYSTVKLADFVKSIYLKNTVWDSTSNICLHVLVALQAQNFHIVSKLDWCGLIQRAQICNKSFRLHNRFKFRPHLWYLYIVKSTPSTLGQSSWLYETAVNSLLLFSWCESFTWCTSQQACPSHTKSHPSHTTIWLFLRPINTY